MEKFQALKTQIEPYNHVMCMDKYPLVKKEVIDINNPVDKLEIGQGIILGAKINK